MRRLTYVLLILTIAIEAFARGYPVYTLLRHNTYRVCSDTGCGSGFNVKYGKERYLVSNWHVCENDTKMEVYSEERKANYQVHVIASLPSKDLCIMDPVAEDALEIGTSLKPNMPVYSGGYPSTSKGKLSLVSGLSGSKERAATEMRKGRDCPDSLELKVTKTKRGTSYSCFGTYDEVYSTMPGWYGRSGSPVINAQGKLVGIVNIKYGDEDPKKARSAYLPVEYLTEVLGSFQSESP